uniref:Aprataxin and PNKP like factor n=1 Tax=Salmo trutta TaxID=8032 RepID=A0A674C2V1_SALTR
MAGFDLVPVDGGSPIHLPEGETLLGRGPFLGVSDKRVSRHHGLLENLNGQLRIKPTHVNPCFCQSSLDDLPQPLDRNQWHNLGQGDIISLLPGKYIYRVVAEPPLLSVMCSIVFVVCGWLMYSYSKWYITPQAFKARQQVTPSKVEESEESDHFDVEEDDGEKRRGGEASTAKGSSTSTSRAEASESEDRGREPQNGQKVGKGPQGSGDVSGPAQSKARLRTTCPYGKDCYRKNPVHFQECSHPGDSDYEDSSAKDEEEEEDADRPECPYGTDCYR